MAGIGHNSVTGSARNQLRSIVERIERLEEEKKAIADDIRDVYAEAKAQGFDTKVLRQVMALRKKDQAERQEQEAIRDLYLQALGMLPEFESSEAKDDGEGEDEDEDQADPDDLV